MDLSQVNPNFLLSVGGIIFAISYAYSTFKQGGFAADQSLIATLKTQYETQKEINTTLQTQIGEMKLEIGKLQGINQSNEKKIQEYMSIISNRNPKLETTLQKLYDVSVETQRYIKNNNKIKVQTKVTR